MVSELRPDACCFPNCHRGQDDPSLRLPLCTFHAHEVAERWCEVTQERPAIKHGAVARRQRNDAARVSGGWIYYLRLGDRIKIGHTTNLRQRLAAYPPDSQLLAVEPGSRQDEAALHQLYQSYCVGGREWYGGRHQPVLDKIDAVIAERGPASAFITPPQRLRRPVEQLPRIH